MADDFLIDDADDLTIASGDFTLGESLTQDVSLILRVNQGELKEDPILGVNLIRMVRSSVDDEELQAKVKIHLQRDGKNYEELRDYIKLKRIVQ